MSLDTSANRRDSFLSHQEVPTDISPIILASWERSLEFAVEADELRAPYREGVNLDTPLLRAARPVLDRMHQVFADEAISMMVTDRHGVILAREVSHAGITTRLNRVALAPGHVFSERYVGTNGIGTALAAGRGVTIAGAEHFVGELRSFLCAAVPLYHPVRKTQLGSFNLTTVATEHSNRGTLALALALAETMGREIENELVRISSVREYILFERYMAACRVPRAPAVLAINAELTMMNDKLQSAIMGADQDALLDNSRSFLADRRVFSSRLITLPSGRVVELKPADGEEPTDAGMVFYVRLVRREAADRPTPESRPVLLSGVIGSMPSWTRAMRHLHSAYVKRLPTAVIGEPGVGKLYAISAVQRSGSTSGRLIVLEPPAMDDSVQAWIETFHNAMANADTLVVLRSAHWMEQPVIDAVVNYLNDADMGAGRLAITAPAVDLVDERLLAQFEEIIELPSIRHRKDDILRLVHYFARRFRPRGDLEFNAAAESVLLRCLWPGNVRQIESVVRTVARIPQLRQVGPDDLPAECRVLSPRTLTVIEALERDAIVRLLTVHAGNVVQAAAELGLSRATVYRKLRRYGIDLSTV